MRRQNKKRKRTSTIVEQQKKKESWLNCEKQRKRKKSMRRIKIAEEETGVVAELEEKTGKWRRGRRNVTTNIHIIKGLEFYMHEGAP